MTTELKETNPHTQSRGDRVKQIIKSNVSPDTWNWLRDTRADLLKLKNGDFNTRYPYVKQFDMGMVSVMFNITHRRQYERITDMVGERQFFEGVFMPSLRSDDIVWDVGASTGPYTLSAAKVAKEVIAFEPDPESAQLLQDNIDLNHLENVTVIPKVAWDKKEPVKLLTNGPNGPSPITASAGKLAKNNKIYEEEITVPGIPLSSLVIEGAIPSPTVVKMDVEGDEAKALSGMLNAIKPRDIFIEVHKSLLDKPEEVRNLLNSNGYSLQLSNQRVHELLCYYSLSSKI